MTWLEMYAEQKTTPQDVVEMPETLPPCPYCENTTYICEVVFRVVVEYPMPTDAREFDSSDVGLNMGKEVDTDRQSLQCAKCTEDLAEIVMMHRDNDLRIGDETAARIIRRNNARTTLV